MQHLCLFRTRTGCATLSARLLPGQAPRRASRRLPPQAGRVPAERATGELPLVSRALQGLRGCGWAEGHPDVRGLALKKTHHVQLRSRTLDALHLQGLVCVSPPPWSGPPRVRSPGMLGCSGPLQCAAVHGSVGRNVGPELQAPTPSAASPGALRRAAVWLTARRWAASPVGCLAGRGPLRLCCRALPQLLMLGCSLLDWELLPRAARIGPRSPAAEGPVALAVSRWPPRWPAPPADPLLAG